jgi:hypothetical protein
MKKMYVLSKESSGNHNVGCIAKDVQIIWAIEGYFFLEREMHKKCKIIFLREFQNQSFLYAI